MNTRTKPCNETPFESQATMRAQRLFRAWATTMLLLCSSLPTYGQYSTESPLEFGLQSVQDVVVADLDNDGLQDIVATHYVESGSNQLSIRAGLAGGGFAAAANFDIYSEGATNAVIPNHVAAVDMNSDGLLDLVVMSLQFAVLPTPNWHVQHEVYLNAGSLLFSLSISITDVAFFGQNQTLVDYDGDGNLDICTCGLFDITLSGIPQVHRLRGDGSGGLTFDTPIVVGARDAIASGDIDNDGDPDLVVIGSGMSVLLGDGVGGFNVGAPLLGPFLTEQVELEDFDGNGTLDLIGVNGDPNGFFIGLGDGAGNFFFSSFSTSTSTDTVRPVRLALADVDSDQVLDLILALEDPPLSQGPFFDGRLQVLLGNGSGGLQGADPVTGAAVPMVDLAITRPTAMFARDVDADGDVDIVTGCLASASNAGVCYYANDTDPVPTGLVRGDVNTDGARGLLDALGLLSWLFIAGTAPLPCDDAADVTDDGAINLIDALLLLQFLFGPTPAVLPPPNSCGSDPTTDSIGCTSFTSCP